jgi:hypothetical protein
VARLRWTIAGALRDQLIYMARQDRWTLASIGNAWGICTTRVAQIAMPGLELFPGAIRKKPRKTAYYSRAQ